ncbi:unnamed protein product [Arabis nemorensis]|uniref:Uncharacterized protein n=1 Tax=Arabis nemorensis TaxID=586526 RepID=A0A565BV26_9BRAS|nr:unnamed protein product [Arabis nemorensis]
MVNHTTNSEGVSIVERKATGGSSASKGRRNFRRSGNQKGVGLSPQGLTRNRSISWRAYRDNSLMKHIPVLTLKRKQWVIKLLLTQLVWNQRVRCATVRHRLWLTGNCQARMRTEHMYADVKTILS